MGVAVSEGEKMMTGQTATDASDTAISMQTIPLNDDPTKKYRVLLYIPNDQLCRRWLVDADDVESAKAFVVRNQELYKNVKLTFDQLRWNIEIRRTPEEIMYNKQCAERAKRIVGEVLDCMPTIKVADLQKPVLTEGTKHDQQKVPYHLLSFYSLECIAKVLEFGAQKYSERNWEKGIKWSRVFRACIGHLFDWFVGKGPDPETGMSHLWHAACCIMFLIHYEEFNKEFDDRPIKKTEGK